MNKLSYLLLFLGITVSTFGQKSEIPLIGEKAPSFHANTTNGEINFPEDFGKSWKILFSHPRDFTPVCSSEILALATMQNEFKDLNVKIAIVSTDNIMQHQSWKQSIEEIEVQGKKVGKIIFPFIDDESSAISRKYGMLHDPVSTTKDVRGVFIIDPDNVIQSINFYPMNIGRNMVEIERIVVALQNSKSNQVLMPANWKVGDDVLMPFKPFENSELANNPKLAEQYYNIGDYMWYKKMIE